MAHNNYESIRVTKDSRLLLAFACTNSISSKSLSLYRPLAVRQSRNKNKDKYYVKIIERIKVHSLKHKAIKCFLRNIRNLIHRDSKCHGLQSGSVVNMHQHNFSIENTFFSTFIARSNE